MQQHALSFFEGVRKHADDLERLSVWLIAEHNKFLRETPKRPFWWSIFPFENYDTFSLVKVPRDVLHPLLKCEDDVANHLFGIYDDDGKACYISLVGIAMTRLWHSAKPEWMPADPLAELLWLQEAGADLSQPHQNKIPFPGQLLLYAHHMDSSLVRRVLHELRFSFAGTCSNRRESCAMDAWLNAYYNFITPSEEDELNERDEAVMWELFDKVLREHQAHDADKCDKFIQNYVQNMNKFGLDLYRKLRARGYNPFTPTRFSSHVARLITLLVFHKDYIDSNTVITLLEEVVTTSDSAQWHRVCEVDTEIHAPGHDAVRKRPESLIKMLIQWCFSRRSEPGTQRIMQHVMRRMSVEELNKLWLPYNKNDGNPMPYESLLTIVLFVTCKYTLSDPSTVLTGAKMLLENGVDLGKDLFREAMICRDVGGNVKRLLVDWARGRLRVRRSWSKTLKWPWVAHYKEPDSPFYHLPRELMRCVMDFVYISGSAEITELLAQYS